MVAGAPASFGLDASEEEVIRAIEEDVNSLGMNMSRTSFPDDLEVFFGIYLDDNPKAEDVNRRFRLGSLKVHPDKKAHYGSKVRERCTELQAAMCGARDALLERIEHGCEGGVDGFPWHGAGPVRRRAAPAAYQRREPRFDSSGFAPGKPESCMDQWLRQNAKLWGVRMVVMKRVRQEGLALKHASGELRADREVVLAAVGQDGLALKFACPELRADPEVVSVALKQDPLALEHAAPELRAERELVLEAVRRNAFALPHASDELRAEAEIVLAALKKSEAALSYAAESLRDDADFLFRAMQVNVHVLDTLPVKWRADRSFMLKVVSRNGFALKYATAALRADPDVIEAALSQDSRAAVHAATGGRCPQGHALQPALAEGLPVACGFCTASIKPSRCLWRCRLCCFASCSSCRPSTPTEAVSAKPATTEAMRKKASEWAARVKAAEDEAARRNAEERAARLKSARDSVMRKGIATPEHAGLRVYR